MISIHGTINSRDYLHILNDQVYVMAQALFPEENIFQDSNAQSIELEFLEIDMRNTVI